MGKILTAQDLLKEKGYIEEKFDTNGFLQCVADWFRSHNIEDKLIIRPKRFIEMDNPPKDGWLDMTNVDEWIVSLPWEQQLLMLQKGTAVPFIWVDEPFVKNAVFTLKTMAGYVVKRAKKGVYEISLL
ncbi:hypothetical protein [Prevotella histicola]|uniref:Uncharacterized protein n=1 Tax=Prevotella histicola JCM 15637 = DNF00424 TaxID=1236504 RepID=A0AAW3FEF3_9BACT|nr:hypothetical protein [Prevotella histicola]KGF24866.1 hypothetical protein HMPREF2132_11260 [Prevotella histicola JCM 15637 = DNF00424]